MKESHFNPNNFHRPAVHAIIRDSGEMLPDAGVPCGPGVTFEAIGQAVPDGIRVERGTVVERSD